MFSRDGTDAVAVQALTKSYGDKQALAGVDLTIPRGVVHGLLGPNGAGKTTMVRILATLLRPSTGHATVAGFDVLREPDEVRYRIGLLGQHAALDQDLSGRQNLELFARLYHLGADGARGRTRELLERFDLTDAAAKPVKQYSGGMRRRLDLAASLITAPDVLFLDEPTTGLDPRGRAEVWDAVRSLADGGTTVLLTTQYLEEADQLADRISVVQRGRIIADGTADDLKGRLGADRLDVVVHDAAQVSSAVPLVQAAAQADDVVADQDRRLISAPVTDRMSALSTSLRSLEDAGIEIEDVALRRPTLDEVFLHLTGDEPIEHTTPEVSA
ncbi:ATP-binding cassette domain-containing protein [Phytoactinopolyspora halotolerans]|uniref:ATP-binding cassette domain-containing protein n=1 Tax=Phytoactinopolyspora halotolerans TaxID=1981512 RepID=UPI001C203A73|nr:ATP-binding cassette domain-containing protein [Phytoactinopolyspora halotolerans]